jgi:hypothetical protein
LRLRQLRLMPLPALPFYPLLLLLLLLLWDVGAIPRTAMHKIKISHGDHAPPWSSRVPLLQGALNDVHVVPITVCMEVNPNQVQVLPTPPQRYPEQSAVGGGGVGAWSCPAGSHLQFARPQQAVPD